MTADAALKSEWCPYGLNCQAMIKNGFCEKFHEGKEFRELKQKHSALMATQQGIELAKQRPLTGFEKGAQMAENAAAQAEKSGNRGKRKNKRQGREKARIREQRRR